jgi:sporulation protein YlmC with PRC-barrel domain
MMRLASDVLDKEILDADGLKAGKVDDIVLELRDGEPPLVRAIVTGQGLGQIGGAISAASAWLGRVLLGPELGDAAVEIGWQHITRIDVTVHIDLKREQAGLQRVDEAVWERWVKHLPLAER